MADGLSLGQPGITEQRAGGFQTDAEIIAAETGQVERGELLAQRAPRRFKFEMPFGQSFFRGIELRRGNILREQDLRGLQAFQFGGQIRGGCFA